MWADYFEDYSELRGALLAGIDRPVPPERADEFYRRVGAFLHDVDDLLGSAGAGEWGSGVTA